MKNIKMLTTISDDLKNADLTKLQISNNQLHEIVWFQLIYNKFTEFLSFAFLR